MKVSSITSYSQNSYTKHHIVGEKRFEPTYNGHWNLDVLKKTDDEVLDLAKYFYKSSPKELQEVTTVTTPLLGIKRKFASLAAYYKMKNATDKIEAEVQNIKTRLLQLEQLYHIGTKEAMEIKSLNAQLEQYDKCFAKRYDKFYYQEESLDEEVLDKNINPFKMPWEDEILGK